MMNVHVDVCIVGAGPSGALLGYLLAKEGVSTIVIERTSGKVGAFRGEHINAESEAILQEHRLYEKVETKGLLKMKKVEYVDGERIVKQITPNDTADHVGIHVPQDHLIHTILDEASKLKHFQLFYNTTVTELLQDENGAYCGVKVKKENEHFTIRSSIVVGADGRFSTVRKLADIPVETIHHGYDVLWAKITAPFDWEPTVRMLQVEGNQLALFTQTGGYIQIGWNIKEGSFNELKQTPFETFMEPLTKSFPQLKQSVAELQSWRDLICFHVHSSKTATWVKDGLVIIGDAAHTMTPTGAIGINAGLKDAHILAPILTEAIAEMNFSKDTLKKFELMRRAEVEAQQEGQIVKEKTFAENFRQVSVV
ncbi:MULTISPECIES: FAD-dependent monooxygenase [Sutcliffiella]|nr:MULTISPECIES: FAD-dependent monooxygenase [Sutcliffiella]MED4015083.1 FAD-dependent monooxygenase [Sutcliffiella cohnii]WBL17192.1 FAD-dependent monooxygenase [Sutcliffiella sp. NC1]